MAKLYFKCVEKIIDGLKENKRAFYNILCCASSYASMYKDIRQAIDLCHRDGTLKQQVAKDPKR